MSEHLKKLSFMQMQMKQMYHLSEVYNRIISYSTTIPSEVLKRDAVVLTDATALSPEKRLAYSDFITTASTGRSVVGTRLLEDKNGYSYALVSASPQKGKGGSRVIVTEQVINSTRAEAIHLGYVNKFVYAYKQDGAINLVAASQFVVESPTIQNDIKQLLKMGSLDNRNRIIGTLHTPQDGEFEVIFEPSRFDPHFFVGVLVPLKTIQVTVYKIIFGAFSFLLLICIGILFIYSAIVRKITTSIEILASVSKKMADGDLNQQVYVSSQDEIGALSATFNQMIRNLRESAANLLKEKTQSEAIVSSIPEGLIVTDLHNRVIMANQRAQEIFRFDLQKARGQLINEHIDNPILLTSLDEILKDQKPPMRREITLLGLDKKNRIYSIHSSVVRNSQRYILGLVTVFRDITRDRELEELRDSFLHTVSHELRTPLTSIIGFIELVKGPKVSEEQDAYLQIALDEAMNLKNLIDDLLDLSRIEAGKIALFYGQVNCKEMIDHLISSMGPLVKGKPLTLASLFTDTSLVIDADLPKLRRVLVNLVSNAIKFTHKGSVVVDCKVEDSSVVFSVTDTGVGLPEDEKAVIFEKFRQLDYSSTRQYEGIGLGLSIVKQLVELHGGITWVESIYGTGSTFYFKIPMRATPAS